MADRRNDGPRRHGLACGNVLVTRDQELWGIALWLQKAHGEEGGAHIAKQIERLTGTAYEAGIAMWLEVAQRYEELRERTSLQ